MTHRTAPCDTVAAAARLESMGRSGDLTGAADAWGSLERAMARLLNSLSAFKKGGAV